MRIRTESFIRASMAELMEVVHKVAQLDTTVMLTGESGVGKD